MASIAVLKERIEKLDPNQISSLERWLDEREQWAQGTLKDCFVIMPFSMTRDGRSKDYWTGFFENFLTNSLVDCGYRAMRSAPTQDNIVQGIMEDLAWSDLVVAVLTDFNPNVWYELGVRHSLRRGGTIMVCQSDQISSLPFDLKQHGVVAYPATLDQSAFVAGLQLQLEKVDGKTEDSPVSSFLDAGLSYCIHRALSGRRRVLNGVKPHLTEGSTAFAEAVVRGLNVEWANQDLQVSVFKDDKLIIHQGGCPAGSDANRCFLDATINKGSQYPRMKQDGRGIWVGSLENHFGRLTAVAYETLPALGWLVAVEAHARQADL